MSFSSERINKPIFIVGSPRSGTSILTWCLGQHSNILVQEESNWIGRLAIQIGGAYEIGTLRGERSQLSALNVRCTTFFARFGATINSLILDQRKQFEDKLRARSITATAVTDALPASENFRITRAPTDPKQRWVDGTPEYCFYIYELRKLFPESRFIHLVRDVESVVRSILNFERTGGSPLVENEQQAYELWLRSERSCYQAEIAYGHEVVRRVRYSDLIEEGDTTMKSLLNFLHEPFESACTEPLRSRINSSNVPEDFDSTDHKTNPQIMNEAKRLSLELQGDLRPIEPSATHAIAMEAEFNDRVRKARDWAAIHFHDSQRIAQLEKEIRELQARIARECSDPGTAAESP